MSGSSSQQSHQGAETQESDNAWNERPPNALGGGAWLLELKLTIHPRTTNLLHIRRLIDIYDTKIKYLQDNMLPHSREGMFVLQAAADYHQTTHFSYRESLKSRYRVKERHRRQMQDQISRIGDRKSRLEEAFKVQKSIHDFSDEDGTAH